MEERKKKAEDGKKKAEEPKKSEDKTTVKAENKGKGKVPSFGKKEEPKFNTQVLFALHRPRQSPTAIPQPFRSQPPNLFARAASRWAPPKALTSCPATAKCA